MLSNVLYVPPEKACITDEELIGHHHKVVLTFLRGDVLGLDAIERILKEVAEKFESVRFA